MSTDDTPADQPKQQPAKTKTRHHMSAQTRQLVELDIASKKVTIDARAAKIAREVYEAAQREKLTKIVDPLLASERPARFGISGALDVLWQAIRMAAAQGQANVVAQSARMIAELEGTLIARSAVAHASVSAPINVRSDEELIEFAGQAFGPSGQRAMLRLMRAVEDGDVQIANQTQADVLLAAALRGEEVADGEDAEDVGEDDAGDPE